MKRNLNGKKVAILVTDGFEETELTSPRDALTMSGAVVEIVSPKPREVQGWRHFEKGEYVPVHAVLDEANPDDYDALVLPGGVANPDQLRMDPAAVTFVRRFFEQGKPIAAICHGPWTLIEAGVVNGCRMTSYPSIRTDLINAGAEWEDSEVVVDNGLVTSRSPEDLDAFNAKMLEEIEEGAHPRRSPTTTAARL